MNEEEFKRYTLLQDEVIKILESLERKSGNITFFSSQQVIRAVKRERGFHVYRYTEKCPVVPIR